MTETQFRDRMERHFEVMASAPHSPIPIESLDIAKVDSGVYGANFERPVRFVQQIEGEVVPALAPRIRHMYGVEGVSWHLPRYLSLWEPVESRHDDILRAQQEIQGTSPQEPEMQASFMDHVVAAMNHVPYLRPCVEMLFYVKTNINEIMGFTAYDRLEKRAMGLGEAALAEVLKRIKRQEAPHIAYGKMAAEHTWSTLSAVQRRVAKRLLIVSNQALGAGTDSQKVQMGYVALDLSEGDIGRFTERADKSLLEIVGDENYPKLSRIGIDECVDMAKISQSATLAQAA